MYYFISRILCKLNLFLRERRTMAAAINSPRRKRAIVIGISEYEEGRKLPNAVNDAKDMSKMLAKIGFIIDEPKLNLKNKDIKHALVDFDDQVKPGDMVLFYFAGHGIQFEVCINMSDDKVVFICSTFSIFA